MAQALPNSSQPVEISAAHSLEWNRTAKTYTAKKNAVAVQGASRLQSDTITAHYNDANGVTDISKLVAEKNVVIQSSPYTAVGDRAEYDVKTGEAVMTGNDLKISTPAENITARDNFKFFSAENKITANGNVLAVRGADTLSADTLSAYFGKDASGKTIAQKLTAQGNVTIKTGKETATGDEGVYDLTTEKSVLTGHVKIRQGQNWLEGTRAEINMKTGLSQLFGTDNAAAGGRVTGTFYPKSSTPPLPNGQKK